MVINESVRMSVYFCLTEWFLDLVDSLNYFGLLGDNVMSVMLLN